MKLLTPPICSKEVCELVICGLKDLLLWIINALISIYNLIFRKEK